MRWIALSMLLVIANGCGGEPAPAPQGVVPAYMGEDVVLEPLPDPPADGANIKTHHLAKTDSESLHLVQLRGSLTEHWHESHDETVVVLRGTGKMTLGERTVDMKPGSTFVIPRGMKHSVTADPGVEAVAVSIFTPPYDGKDRHFTGSDK